MRRSGFLSNRFLAMAVVLAFLIPGVGAFAQASAVPPFLAGKLPGQYKVGETESYCFRSDGTVRHWGAWGERWGTWTAQGPQGVITWTKDEVYKPAKPFRDAFNYYEDKGKAKLKLWSLDMPVPAYYGAKTALACEQVGDTMPTGPGILSFAGVAWDEWTARNKVFGDAASDEVRHQESAWTVDNGVLSYKGTGAQSYQNDFVASQKAYDMGEVAVTFEATGSFRTEFGYCGPQVVFTDPQQMNSEGPTASAYGVIAYYSWEPGKNDSGLMMVGGPPPGKAYAAKFADAGDAEYRPYKLEVKAGKVTLTSPAGVFTADAPTAKAGVKLPLVIALRQYDRGRVYTFKMRNLKVVESAASTTTVPPVVTPTVPPVVPVTGPVFGKPCAPPEEFVQSIYRTILGREADPEGLRATTERVTAGRSREETCKELFLSQEYTNRKRSDEEFVRDAYRTYLGREADSGGLTGFLSILQKAKKDFMSYLDPAGVQRNARSKVLDSFTDSGEYTAIKAACK